MYEKEVYNSWTIEEYRKYLQKTSPEGEHETYTGRTVRFFSIYLTRALTHTNLSPDQITVISVLIFLAGVSMFIFNDYGAGILGASLVYISIIFDACDGEIARLKGSKSGIGGIYTEPVSHDIQYALMFIPLTLGAYATNQNIVIIYAGFFAAVFKLMTRFITYRFQMMKYQIAAVAPSGQPRDQRPKSLEDICAKSNTIKKIYWYLNRNIFSSVGLVFPLLIFAVFSRIDLFIWLYAIGFIGIFFIHFLNQVIYIMKLSKK